MQDWITPVAIYDKCGEAGATPASATIDGNPSTSWAHLANEKHWIAYDHGVSLPLSRMKILQPAAFRFGGAIGIKAYVTDDPATWGTAVWEGVLNAAGWQQTGVFAAIGRYVKLESKLSSMIQSFYEYQAEVGGDVEVVLHLRLANSTTLVALVANRIHPLLMPQEPILPSVTYQRIDAPRLHTFLEDGILARPRIQIDSWDRTYAGVKAVATQVRTALEGWSDFASSIEAEDETYEAEENIYRVRQDWFVWYHEV